MATKNSINNKSQELTLDPGASGDSFVQFDINGTGEFRIGVDDTDDSFRISQGSALGTNDTFIMTDAGERTMPLQPAFHAYLSSNQNNVTGDGTSFDPICDTEVFDQGGDYNNGTGVFTAPIDGRYLFSIGLALSGLGAANTRGTFSLVTSDATFYAIDADFGNMRQSIDELRMTQYSIIADMDSADTAYINTVVYNGTKIVIVSGVYTIFACCLIC